MIMQKTPHMDFLTIDVDSLNAIRVNSPRRTCVGTRRVDLYAVHTAHIYAAHITKDSCFCCFPYAYHELMVTFER